MTSRVNLQVGYIGLVPGGASMARGIAAAGFDLMLWRKEPTDLDVLDDVPNTVCETLADLGAVCDLVAIRDVPSDGDVRSIVTELVEAMKPGAVIAVHRARGTPADSRLLAQMGAERGIFVLDAPLSKPPTFEGDKWGVMMVGGDARGFELARPVFESFVTAVHLVGPPGSGQVLKLLNNALLAANLANAQDALSATGNLDLDWSTALEVMESCSGSSFALRSLSPLYVRSQVERVYRELKSDPFQSAEDLVAASLSLADQAAALYQLQLDHLEIELRASGTAGDGLLERGRQGAADHPSAIRHVVSNAFGAGSGR